MGYNISCLERHGGMAQLVGRSILYSPHELPPVEGPKRTLGGMAQLVEHIVHIDGVTGSSPVVTTRNPLRRKGFHFFYFQMRVTGYDL